MQKDTLKDLKIRKAVAEAAVRELKKSDDPRAEDALSHYQKQLAEINEKIEQFTSEPPEVVVGLKTAALFPKVSHK